MNKKEVLMFCETRDRTHGREVTMGTRVGSVAWVEGVGDAVSVGVAVGDVVSWPA